MTADLSQLALTGTPTPPDVKLTGRQRLALERIAKEQPVTSADLGGYLHSLRRNGHLDDFRCAFCQVDGARVGASLRDKKLVRFSRKHGGWTLPDYRPPAEPLGELPEDF